MEQTENKNANGDVTSLQVSYLESVPQGDSNFGRGVLIKNITDEAITISVKLVNNNNFITTKLYPGWNPELIIAIASATADTLQYGY